MQAKDDDDLHGGQRSTEVKYSKLCSMATKLGQKNRWCKFRMIMTFMEVKDQQRSNVVNYALWLPNLEEPLMQTKDDDELFENQRSTEVKYSKLRLWLPSWSEESLM